MLLFILRVAVANLEQIKYEYRVREETSRPTCHASAVQPRVHTRGETAVGLLVFEFPFRSPHPASSLQPSTKLAVVRIISYSYFRKTENRESYRVCAGRGGVQYARGCRHTRSLAQTRGGAPRFLCVETEVGLHVPSEDIHFALLQSPLAASLRARTCASWYS
ncbi:unnamed protein product [Pieris macdunnoughi]|uniref:Uncharacterized protein n=1 Tax=Pieris macdunnoughi TaxID=345717 RepID=A0A821LVC8_9NEOP|nr:unnamed protein product [Pieris macdunnoughi]